jgi:adenylate kinase family enzyme
MLPVIFLIGCPSSGKGTLGARLAAEFRLCHVSLADAFKDLIKARRGPIDGMPEEINACLLNRVEIPQQALSNLRTVPVALRLHNCRVRDEFIYELAPAVLQEKIEESMAQHIPRAVIVDGLNIVCSRNRSRGNNMSVIQAVDEFAPSFSGLTILIQCPREVAKKRYLSREDDTVSEETFEKRMQNYETNTPKLLQYLEKEGIVVEISNDDAISIDQDYGLLVDKLSMVPLWRFLAGKRER